MPTATITSKGQLTLPKEIRMILGLHRGDKLRFFRNKKGEYVMEPVTTDIKELEGCLPKPKKAVSIEEMNSVIRNKKLI